MLLNSVLLTLPLLVTAPLLVIGVRRYLKRAPKGYITEGSTYSTINTTLTETVEGARTVEALRAAAHSGRDRRRGHRGLGAGRALHDVAAQHPVLLHRARVRHPAGDGDGAGRGRVQPGLRDPGPDHGGDPLRAGAGGAAGAADPQPGPAAGRCRLDHPAARHRGGPAGPGGRRRPADRDPAGGPGPALRLPRGSRRAARGHRWSCAGGAAGHRRTQRLRQVDPGTAALGDQPAAYGSGHRRRRRPRVAAAGSAADRGGAGDPGAPRVLRHHPGQHRAGPGGLLRRGGGRGACGRSTRTSGSTSCRRSCAR